MNGGVCLCFGGSDYEGLPYSYSFTNGVLKDQDGDEITTRPIECDSSEVDVNGVGVGVDDVDVDNIDNDIIDLVSDLTDHENDMYMGKGLTPDFIKDELQDCLDEDK